jgi:DsbC/DsbD-like thiol-disulfide interchange protein
MVKFVPSRIFAQGLFIAAFASAALAQDASDWVADGHSAVRLMAGSRTTKAMLGGIAFRLQPGWKTYWRTPGDSGVPPRFDFSASDNIESVTVLWPAPMKFSDGAGGASFGYTQLVTLPLRIVAKNPDKPVTLRATVDYAVCEKLCIPVVAKAEVSFRNSSSMEDGTLKSALETVPHPVKIGATNPLTIQNVKRDGHRVLVDVATSDSKEANLFVEGPTAEWALPAPTLLERLPTGVQRFAFDLEGLPPDAQAKGATLKLTLVGENQAYEFNALLD